MKDLKSLLKVCLLKKISSELKHININDIIKKNIILNFIEEKKTENIYNITLDTNTIVEPFNQFNEPLNSNRDFKYKNYFIRKKYSKKHNIFEEYKSQIKTGGRNKKKKDIIKSPVILKKYSEDTKTNDSDTINSKMDDLKSLKLHVSIKHGKDSLLKEQNEDDIESNSTDKNNKNYINSNGEDASIIEYEPEIFNDLRKNDEISDDIMIKVFSPSKNKSAIDKMSESKGKSGSFFFYSHDRKFIIKTITEGEKSTLSNILHDYYNYIKDHKNTVITKIYGIYTIVIKNASSVNVILMQNLFGCSPIHIQRMFDLKGSEVQRQKIRRIQKKNHYLGINLNPIIK